MHLLYMSQETHQISESEIAKFHDEKFQGMNETCSEQKAKEVTVTDNSFPAIPVVMEIVCVVMSGFDVAH